jgi:putative transposase
MPPAEPFSTLEGPLPDLPDVHPSQTPACLVAYGSYQGTSSDVPIWSKKKTALAAAMAIPLRRADPAHITASVRTFFVTSSTARKRNLLQSDRAARLFLDVLYHNRSEGKYLLHDFVVMPDHVHLLLTVGHEISIERAVQFIKGGFAFRAGRELGCRPPVWERGFSEVRLLDAGAFRRFCEYIGQNPIKRGLAGSSSEYPFCSLGSGIELDAMPQGLKPMANRSHAGTPEGVP